MARHLNTRGQGRRKVSELQKAVDSAATGDKSIRAFFRESEVDITPPDWLGPIGTAYWKKITPLLKNTGTLSELDVGVVENLCAAYEVFRECDAIVRREGPISESNYGNKVRNPAITSRDSASKEVQRLWIELGMTPASRSKAEKLITVQEDGWGGFDS